MKKLSLNDAYIIAKSHGGVCLSTEYKNAKSPLIWRCSKNHIWSALLKKVKYDKSWCPHCAGHVKLTLKDAKQIAISKHGQCLSTEYINNKTPMLWKCHQGHMWNTPFRNIKYSETWCPHCAGMPFQTKYSINDAHMIAKNRGGQCLSSSFINSMMPLQWRCAESHEWTVSLVQIINSGSWCPHCAGNARCTIDDARQVAQSRNGDCLSDKYINNNMKLQWRCTKGHEWLASFGKIKNSGSWCPECSHRKPYTLEYVKQYAYNKNGKCLSEKYINSDTPLQWRCIKGHEWIA